MADSIPETTDKVTEPRHGIWQRGPFFKIPGMAGIRAFGWQFDVADHRVMPPLFSERYGYGTDRYRHVGPFCIRSGRLRRAGRSSV